VQYPTWMPPVVDDRPKRGKGNPAATAGSAEDYLARVIESSAVAARKAGRPDFVQRGKTWRAKARRWILRACWRLFRKTLRKAWARKALLAPFLLGWFSWFFTAILHFVDRGWVTVLASFGTGALVVYWTLGGWAWVVTRRRGLRPLPQRLWTAAGYATLMLLSTLQAAWRIGAPMPGLWMIWALTFTSAVGWYRHQRPKENLVDLDERHRLWDKIKKVKGAELQAIQDLENPTRWIANVDLSEVDMLVADLAGKAAHIAKRYRTSRGNVIVDEATPGEDALARLTVVLENPLFKPVVFDDSWLQIVEQGTFPFHAYPDGSRGHFRLFKPKSGTVNALFSGDIDGGKSAGMFAAAIQALFTGRCHLIVGDPQGGQSLPALVGARGIAEMKATNPEQVYHQLVKVHAGMLARSEYLQGYVWRDSFGDLRYGMQFFDQDIMAAQVTDPETGEHPLYWPIIIYILDEAHRACKDPEYGTAIAQLLAQILKLSRKTGISLWLATQYPGIEEIGNDMALRNQLVSGNVICYRNSARYTGTMVLSAHMPEPHTIPKITPEGQPTQGMAVVETPAVGSTRPTIARTVYMEREGLLAEQASRHIYPIDDVTRAAFEAVDADAQEAAVAEQLAAYQASKAGAGQSAAAVPAQAGAAQPPAAGGEQPWKQGTVLQRCVAYLQHLEQTTGVGETTTGVLAEATGSSLTAVSTAMGRAAKTTPRRPVLCHSPRTGTWALGQKPAEELVGAAA
jgi:hypothetical protein